MDYEEFIRRKKHSQIEYGFGAVFYPDIAFDFQKEIIARACKKGRYAVFADTGLVLNIKAAGDRFSDVQEESLFS